MTYFLLKQRMAAAKPQFTAGLFPAAAQSCGRGWGVAWFIGIGLLWLVNGRTLAEGVGAPPSLALATNVWNNFPELTFTVDGRDCLLLQPKTAAVGAPWIWRTRFFGVEPQADLALLSRGWRVAYMDLHDMYGAPRALDHMDRFYECLTNRFQLAPKVVLEGFSRGGLFAFNWAARHPNRVACLYVDAPVCDFKSWPAGWGKGKGSAQDWVRCKAIYGFTSDAQARAYPFNPVDNLAPLAQAQIPILSVCGDADTVVPMPENTSLVRERYEKLGGEIKVITKPGGEHHPHSLKDPQPIVDFILAHPAVPGPVIEKRQDSIH